MVHVGWGEKGPRGEIDTAGPYQTKAAAPTAARRRRQLSRTWLPLHTRTTSLSLEPPRWASGYQAPVMRAIGPSCHGRTTRMI